MRRQHMPARSQRTFCIEISPQKAPCTGDKLVKRIGQHCIRGTYLRLPRDGDAVDALHQQREPLIFLTPHLHDAHQRANTRRTAPRVQRALVLAEVLNTASKQHVDIEPRRLVREKALEHVRVLGLKDGEPPLLKRKQDKRPATHRDV
eukprot:4024008-Pleurochrysis_carterae.AAC.2